MGKKPPIPYIGLHLPCPTVQFTPFKFINLAYKTLQSWDFSAKQN